MEQNLNCMPYLDEHRMFGSPHVSQVRGMQEDTGSFVILSAVHTP